MDGRTREPPRRERVVCAFCGLVISLDGRLVNSCRRLSLITTDADYAEVAVCAGCEQRGAGVQRA